jgi:prolipoprotein diacylglyceryltransferase
MERKMDGFDVGHLRERSKPFWHFLYESFFEQLTLFLIVFCFRSSPVEQMVTHTT